MITLGFIFSREHETVSSVEVSMKQSQFIKNILVHLYNDDFI